MKKSIFFFAVTALFLLLSSNSNAQYKNALGVRVGDDYGITFKTFLQSDKALDFILHLKDRDNYSLFRLTGLYEKHLPLNISEIPELRWYYGGGGTLGSIHYKKPDESKLFLSVDGVIGLDYKFTGAPINLALDWRPAIELTPSTDFDPNGLGLSVRITF